MISHEPAYVPLSLLPHPLCPLLSTPPFDRPCRSWVSVMVSQQSASKKPSKLRESESSLISQHLARACHDRKWHEITIVGSQPPERVCLLPHFVYAVLLQRAARQDIGSPPAVLAVNVSQPVSVLGLCVQGSRACGKVSRILRLSAWP
jgi:hypothetical protein